MIKKWKQSEDKEVEDEVADVNKKKVKGHRKWKCYDTVFQLFFFCEKYDDFMGYFDIDYMNENSYCRVSSNSGTFCRLEPN